MDVRKDVRTDIRTDVHTSKDVRTTCRHPYARLAVFGRGAGQFAPVRTSVLHVYIRTDVWQWFETSLRTFVKTCTGLPRRRLVGAVSAPRHAGVSWAPRGRRVGAASAACARVSWAPRRCRVGAASAPRRRLVGAASAPRRRRVGVYWTSVQTSVRTYVRTVYICQAICPKR